MKRPVKVEGKVIDWRDSSVFDVQVVAGQAALFMYRPAAAPCTIEVDTGDGNVYKTIIQTLNSAYYSFVRTFTQGGIYKVRVNSTQLLDGLGCYYVYKYNSGFYKKTTKLKALYNVNVTSNQELTDALGDLDYCNIANSNSKIDLSKLIFNPNCTCLQIINAPNLYGQLRIPILANIKILYIRGTNVPSQGVSSFYDMVKNTPSCTSYDIESYHTLSPFDTVTDLSDLVDLVKDRPMIYLLFYSVNRGITGNASSLFKVLYEKPTFSYFNLVTISTSVIVELGIQQSDFTLTHEKKILYMNRISGDVSHFNFKYRAKTYLYLAFLNTAIGNINSISNIVQDEGSTIGLTLSATTVFLDVSNLQGIAISGLSLTANDNFSGDISMLGNRTMCTAWNLQSLNSYTITGWSNLITAIYNNRASWVLGTKSFICSNVMKAALSGVYQAPPGFIKGNADGTPSTDRERIYVLVNNFNWTFTNI